MQLDFKRRLREETGESHRRAESLVAHFALQQRREKRRFEIRWHDEEAVRILDRLVPDKLGFAARLFQALDAADQAELFPHRFSRIGLRGFQGRIAPFG